MNNNNQNPLLLQLLDQQVDTIHELIVRVMERLDRVESYLSLINIPAYQNFRRFGPNARPRRARRAVVPGQFHQQLVIGDGFPNNELNWRLFALFLVRCDMENRHVPDIPQNLGVLGLPVLPFVDQGVPAQYDQPIMIAVAIGMENDDHEVFVRSSDNYHQDHFWVFTTPNRLYDEGVCVICMNGPAVMHMVCGHVCLCVGCARVLPHLRGRPAVKCPLCREEGRFLKSVRVKFLANYGENGQGRDENGQGGGGNEYGGDVPIVSENEIGGLDVPDAVGQVAV